MLESFINVVHVTVCAILILVVLLQQGRGGGLGSATSAQVFGGRGAGNFMTRLTGICAALFMLTSVTLAYIASSGDAELREYEKQQQQQK
jgi:preprotein translocase subunit SecG